MYKGKVEKVLEIFMALPEDYEGEFEEFQVTIDIYQEYLDKKYLITLQVHKLGERIGSIFWYRLDHKTRRQLSAFNRRQYEINIFDDKSFNIEEIKDKVNKFIGVEEGEVRILTPIESLKEYLKKYDNRITAREYSELVNITYKKALVILKGFVANKELKSKREDRGLYIFYV